MIIDSVGGAPSADKHQPLKYLLPLVLVIIVSVMIVTIVKDHNRGVEMEQFCLDHGYPGFQRANGYLTNRFWCTSKFEAKKASDLGWKEK